MDSQRVLIVEDHHLLGHVLCAALAAEGYAATSVDGSTTDGVLEGVGPGTVVLLDLQLADGRDGSALVAPLRHRGAQVLILTGSPDIAAMGRALDAGALDVLDKRLPFEALVRAVAAAASGAYTGDPAHRHAILRAAHERQQEGDAAAAVLGRLTAREREVLDELCRGRSAEEVAGVRHVSIATVRAQIRSVLSKLEVRSQLAAVARAHQLRRRVALRDGIPSGVARAVVARPPEDGGTA